MPAPGRRQPPTDRRIVEGITTQGGSDVHRHSARRLGAVPRRAPVGTEPAVVALVTATYPDLAGRVAVVTGGSGSIGSATCRFFEANGMRVVPVGRTVADCTDPDALSALAGHIG